MALLVLSCGGYTISRSLCDNASHGWWWPLAQTVVEGIAVDGETLIRMVRIRRVYDTFCLFSVFTLVTDLRLSLNRVSPLGERRAVKNISKGKHQVEANGTCSVLC